MAKRKRKKRGWLRTLIFFILFPLIVWLIAFLVWFYWRDLSALWNKKSAPVDAPARSREHDETRPAKRPPEKILDEDRKKLEEILKRRS